MNVIITPNKLKGDVIVPPSKSLSHRAIIAASLSNGVSKISNVMYSKDILATINAMKSIGVDIKEYDDYLIIKGNGKVKRINDVIDCYESGSTIRFMIPIALVCDEPITFTGKNNLVNRPLDPFFKIFDKQNIKYEKEEAYLPLKVYNGIKSGNFDIEGNISSQFITGLLFSLPLLDGDSVINITTNLESKGYIDLTLDVLKLFGIEIINDNYKRFIIKGNQEYKARDYEIEGDFSQSAFFLVADCLGADINLKSMNINSNQGDKKIIDDIKKLGYRVDFNDGILKAYPGNGLGNTIDFSQSPDLGPALTVLASLTNGKSDFINAERLRIKECDRITSMKTEINKLGGNIIELQDGMIINGVSYLNGGVVDSYNDHRVVMSLAMATLKMKGDLKILNAEAINKSYPNFFKVFEKLGGIIKYE